MTIEIMITILIPFLVLIVAIVFGILSYRKKSEASKFQGYKEKANDMIISHGQLRKAMNLCKKALNHAETDEQMTEIWWIIFDIHTRRQIGASDKISNYIKKHVEWDYKQNSPPPNYQTPYLKDLLK